MEVVVATALEVVDMLVATLMADDFSSADKSREGCREWCATVTWSGKVAVEVVHTSFDKWMCSELKTIAALYGWIRAQMLLVRFSVLGRFI